MAHFERPRRRVMAMLAVSIVVAGLLGPTTASAEQTYCRIQGGGWTVDALGRKVTFAANLGNNNDTAGFRELFEASAGEPIYVRIALETLSTVACSPTGPEPGDGGTIEFEGTGQCSDGSQVEIQGALTDTGGESERGDMQEFTSRGGESPGCTIASSVPCSEETSATGRSTARRR